MCLVLRDVEGKLRLSCIWRQLSPPASIGIETLGQLAAPGGVLFYLGGDDRESLGMTEAGWAKIDALPDRNIRGIFPGGRSDRKG